MKKIIYSIIATSLITFGIVAYAAPTAQNFVNIQPFVDSTYNNGASNLYWLGTYTDNLYLGTTTAGCLQTSSGGIVFSTSVNCGTGSGTSPAFTPTAWGASTTTTLGFLNGFFSTASSTISGNFFLPALSQGSAYIGSAGKVNSIATSTATCTGASGVTCTSFVIIGTGGSTIALSAIPNSSLANSTISGIALGANLADLTPTNTTLTFSGTYNGSTARSIGLNLGNSNTWTVLQNFNYSSSTVYSSFQTSSTTSGIFGTITIPNITGTQCLHTISGVVSGTGSDCGSSSLTGTQGQVAYFNGTNTAIGTSTIFITPAGTVGIGTITPLDVNANADLTVSGLGATDIIASTTDNITASTAIIEAYAPGSRAFLGAHGSNQVATQYGIVSGGWAELGAINSSFGTSNGLMIGTRTTATPIVFGTNSFERMRILSTGQVGIGTTTPFGLLQLATTTASATFKPQLVITDSSATANLKHWTATNEGGNFYLATSSDLYATSTTPSLVVLTNNVVTAPGGFLGQASSTITTTLNVGTSVTTPLVIGGSGSASSLTLRSTSGSGTTDSIIFNTGSQVEAARFNTSGQLGIATTTPVYPLDIFSSTVSQLALSAGTGVVQWTMRNAGGNFYMSTTSTAGNSTSTPAFIINNSGLGVFLGATTTNSATTGLSVAGTGYWTGLTASAGLQTGILCLSSTNEVINESVACVASDERAKDIVGTFTHSLDEIDQINPILYYYKPKFNGSLQDNENFNTLQLGLGARALQKIDPKLVEVYTKDGKNEVFSFKKGEASGPKEYALVTLALGGIKELNDKVNHLSGQAQKSVQDKWQYALIALLFLWVIRLEIKTRK